MHLHPDARDELRAPTRAGPGLRHRHPARRCPRSGAPGGPSETHLHATEGASMWMSSPGGPTTVAVSVTWRIRRGGITGGNDCSAGTHGNSFSYVAASAPSAKPSVSERRPAVRHGGWGPSGGRGRDGVVRQRERGDRAHPQAGARATPRARCHAGPARGSGARGTVARRAPAPRRGGGTPRPRPRRGDAARAGRARSRRARASEVGDVVAPASRRRRCTRSPASNRNTCAAREPCPSTRRTTATRRPPSAAGCDGTSTRASTSTRRAPSGRAALASCR